MSEENLSVRKGAADTIDGLVVEPGPVPAPGKGEILVRIQASSINYADFSIVTGLVPCRGPGLIPMTDGAGVVHAIGEGVTGVRPGDLVMARFYPEWDAGPFDPANAATCGGMTCDGYATRFTVKPAHWFVPVPKGYSAAQAATLGCAALTAWRALFGAAPIKPGDWVMTQGTGGVSIFALQFAKAAGARVIATTSSAAKAEQLKALGADHVINYREDANWGETAFALADGRGVDVIVEIGGGSGLNHSIKAVRPSGNIGLIGVLTGIGGQVTTLDLMLKNATLTGITVGGKDQLTAMVAGIEAAGIKPVISASFPLERLADAFREHMTQRHFGKIVIEM